VAEGGRGAVGCAALRPLDDETCEIKRLYVRPAWRGRGIGRALAETVVAEARRTGYKRMRLDAIRNMTAAVSLYASMGFKEIAPYRHNPIQGAVYMELPLE
jgi:ribosomal protein S18 acetylase RimI-like enzyme